MPQASISFEFFPPKTAEGVDKLRRVREALRCRRPEYYSVTFGAGGTTRDRTLETVLEIQGEGVPAAPHLSCIGATADSLTELLDRYRAAGIGRIVALRGDLPSGMVEAGDFPYAIDLVRFIREHYSDTFRIEVAGYPEVHPESRRPSTDLGHLAEKCRAGADAVITQYFYNGDAYFRLVDELARQGVNLPVVPGIMPIHNADQLVRFSDACGAEIPRWIRRRMEEWADDPVSLRAFGVEVVADLCARLLAGGAPGLHFYTLNQSGSVTAILDRLALPGPC